MISILSLVNPISSVIENLLTRISQICSEEGIPFFVAGATAREILLHHVHGKSIGRRTRDIDIAIFVNEWQVFDQLKQTLMTAGAKEVGKNVHRMFWQSIELDLIPFGGVSEENRVFWPPDRNIIMAVDGFPEAFSNVVNIRLDNSEVIPFCSLPGLALLKMFAWRDRGHADTRDIIDLYKIISEYGAIENNRIYEEPIDGEALGWDPVRMGAALLGYDIAIVGLNDSVAELSKLDKETVTDAILRKSDALKSEETEQIIDDFWHGLFQLSQSE